MSEFLIYASGRLIPNPVFFQHHLADLQVSPALTHSGSFPLEQSRSFSEIKEEPKRRDKMAD